MLTLSGPHYSASSTRYTFTGTGFYDLTDNCQPSLNQHRAVSETLSWAYRPYHQSPTALEFISSQPYPFGDFVFFQCVLNTNCQQHYK